MATNTTNYGWTKPDYEDAADIMVINGTIDNIDAQVKTVETALDDKADKSTTYTKTEVDTALDSKADTSDIPTVPITAIQKNGAGITPVSGTVNITVPTTAADVSALPDTTKYAAALSLTINSSTFVMTGQLKDQNGDNLGTAQTIDLPLESVVVGGSYDSQTKKVVLTLQNGTTIEFSVADLVSGLQTELSASNKLNPAYINYDSTHRAVSDTEKSTWNGKQNALSSAQLDAVNSGITAAKVTAFEGKQDAITSSNKLSADLVDDAATTNKFVTAAEKTAWNGKQNALSSAQLDAVNSGIDSTKVAQIETNKNNISLLTAKTNEIGIVKTINPITPSAANTYECITASKITLPAGKILRITASCVFLSSYATGIAIVRGSTKENSKILAISESTVDYNALPVSTVCSFGSDQDIYVFLKCNSTANTKLVMVYDLISP